MLIQHFNIGKLNGEENAVLNFSKALRQIGITPSIIAQKGVHNLQTVDGIEVYESRQGPYSLGSVLKKIALIKSLDFSLVHSHEVSRAFLHGLLKFDRPFIVHYHNPLSVIPGTAGRFSMTLKRADRIFVPSEFVAKKLSNYSRAIKEKINVVYNGVDIDNFRRRTDFEILEQYGIPDDCDVVAFVGRCSPIKGVLTLVEAIPKVLKEIKDVRFLFVGVKPPTGSQGSVYYNKVTAEISRLGVIRQCIFTHYVPHSQLPYFYSRAAITAAPSILDAFPLTVLESLSCGTPVIASQVGGLPEAVDNNVGALFPVENSDYLAGAIVKLLKDKPLRTKLGVNARKRVEERFTWQSSARKIKQVYQELLESH